MNILYAEIAGDILSLQAENRTLIDYIDTVFKQVAFKNYFKFI